MFLTAGKNSFAEAPREDDNMDAEEIWTVEFANSASLDLSIKGLCPFSSNSAKSSNENSVLKTTILNTFNPQSAVWYDVVHKAGWLTVLVNSKWHIIYSAMALGI